MGVRKMKRNFFVACMAAVAASASLPAGGAVYNASTGYVTLNNSGSGQMQSPLSTTAAIDTGNNRYFWSDQQAVHAGTNYYVNVSIRGILHTADNAVNYEFPGNRIVMGSGAQVAWKSFSPATYTFLNEGAIVFGGCAWRVNESYANRPVIIRGRIELQETASTPFKLFPWGAEQHYPQGLIMDLDATIVADANQRMQVSANTSAAFPRRGLVRILGDMSQFLGTVEVASNRLFVCTDTLRSAKLVKVERCGELNTGVANGGTGSVSKVTVDASSSIGAAATNTLVVADLTLADGAAVRFGWNGTAGCVEVTNSFTAAGMIGVAPADPVNPNTLTNGPARVAVLKVKGTGAFTRDQFVRVPTVAWFNSNAASVVPDDFPGLTFEVEEEDGWTVLYVTLNQVVRQVVEIASGANSGKFHQAATWSNNKIPADNVGCDFYVPSATYLMRYNNQNPYHFPGRSMTLNGVCTYGETGTFVFNQLNVYGGQHLRAWMGDCGLAGNIRLIGANDYTLTHGNGTYQTWYANLSGKANVVALIRAPVESNEGTRICYFEPAGTNTNYTGKWTVSHASASVACATHHLRFTVREPCNLGAPFPTFQYDALTLKNWAALRPGLASSTLDDATRGIYFEGDTQVYADPGRTLALKCPLTFSGTVRKSGSGTLALGGTAKPKFCGATQSVTPLAGTNGLVVTEGWIKPISTNGVDGLAVEFAGGGIRLDYAPTDAGVAAYGFWNTKWSVPFARAEGVTAKVPVSIDMGELTDMPSPVSRYAICTVAADKAAGVKGMLEVQRPFKGYVTGIEERVNADGTVTLLAVIKYGGLTMFIR